MNHTSLTIRSRPPRLTALADLALVVALLGALSLIGCGLLLWPASSPPAHADPPATAPAPATFTGLGATLGASVPGIGDALDQPGRTPDPAAPGEVAADGRDEPDAFELVVGDVHYLYSSQGNLKGINVPVQVATGSGPWGPVHEVMTSTAAWAVPGITWAPDVHRFGDTYVLYFTELVSGLSPATRCIGVATGGTSPLGPFTPEARPFICQSNQGGSIDPRTFTDVDGTTYVIWKSDNNADGGTADTNIYSQPLSANGVSLVGSPTRIFGPDERWQGRIVEAPDLVLADGSYWLFYSGNWYNQSDYAIGTARCAGPLGPCADTSSTPLLASNANGAGPGEESVFTDNAGVWLLYAPFHANDPHPTPPRWVETVRVGFGPTGPYLATDQ